MNANTYRVDPEGRLHVVISCDDLPDPNGICFSPDCSTLYVISTGRGRGDAGPGGKNVIYAFDVQGQKLANQRMFTDMTVDGVHGGPKRNMLFMCASQSFYMLQAQGASPG